MSATSDESQAHFECSAPESPNPPFLISDIRALWRSAVSARVPECQKLKMDGVDHFCKCNYLMALHFKGLHLTVFVINIVAVEGQECYPVCVTLQYVFTPDLHGNTNMSPHPPLNSAKFALTHADPSPTVLVLALACNPPTLTPQPDYFPTIFC